ncbi:hypothetical protein HanOQP8_Chr17g0678431 [Helianthus annuus]|nr:hypothetical protein HanOQP8_Chr17g0678431 [Helianthus annuus]
MKPVVMTTGFSPVNSWTELSSHSAYAKPALRLFKGTGGSRFTGFFHPALVLQRLSWSSVTTTPCERLILSLTEYHFSNLDTYVCLYRMK